MLARGFERGATRRSALKLLAAGVLAALGVDETETRDGRPHGKGKTEKRGDQKPEQPGTSQGQENYRPKTESLHQPWTSRHVWLDRTCVA